MAIDLEPLFEQISDLIDDLPTEATFRGQVINVRIGEAPKTRELLIAGFQSGQVMECLIKREDVGETDPTSGELLTINETNYKIGTVTPLISLSDPPAYRVTIQAT